ncbi:RNA pseudouridine synthase 5 isoform X2 [Oryza brachyantha]|uniref:RNA pseudouridine synthase 5 isoform X2 n=1 Tax=Oryza brachyantha TaxID=4533 RepID=UPI001ADBF832|nr:RNA pseudouridine synthase 5 isoform X2 [Oryza brachyantha]
MAAATTGEIPAEEAPPPRAPCSFGRPWPEFNEGISYTDTFRCADAGATMTLIEFYSTTYKSSAPLPGWIKRIRNGQITVDGEVVTDPDMTLRYLCFLICTDCTDMVLACYLLLQCIVLFYERRPCCYDALFCRQGSKLIYHRLPWQEPFAPHLLGVLYEDDDMIALNKPSGLQVLPKGLFQQRTVLAQLQMKDWKIPSSFCSKQKDVQSHPVPVHRLGRGTSGLLLCAKTKLAKARLAAYFAEGTTNAGKSRDETDMCKVRKISKFYRALVTGILENDEVMITQPIGLVHYPGVAEGLYAACSSGKPAMSKVSVLERLEHRNQTLVQVEIHSGRPHQIRIHLACIGHPLVDDPLYGIGGQPKFDELESSSTDDSFAYDGGYERPLQPVPGDCGYHLHAHWLVLCHPTTNEMIKITAPLPQILQTREEQQDTAKQVGG